MTTQELSKARNTDLPASLSALARAARNARRIAIRTQTAIVIMENGHIVRVPAEQLAQRERQGQDA